MERLSIVNNSGNISTRSATRSQLQANKARHAELKALYHSSFAFAFTNKNQNSTGGIAARETREPTEASPPRVTRSSSEPTSMSPIEIMTDPSPSQDELNNVTPDKRHDSPETADAPTAPDDDANVDDANVDATQQEAQAVETPEERAKRRAAHPMKDIAEPLPTDCLFGRGGGTNHHPGNKLYRKMVEDKKDVYLKSKRLDKPLVAMDIIKEWRELDPPGRFLKQDEVTKLWSDVGDKKAREKTSQALREKTGKSDMEDCDKETRFESGTKLLPRGNLVTRDHSLGTEIIDGEEYYSMEGFSWDELDNREVQDAAPSPTAAYPYVRENSLVRNPLPAADVNHPAHNSFGGYAPPPPPHHHYGHPPPPPLPHHPSPHHPSHHYPPQHDFHHRPSPSDPTHHDRGRNHSLSMNPLPGASTSNPATNSFDDERGRASWGSYSSYDSRAPPPLPPSYYGYGPPPPPPPPAWGSPPSHYYPHGSPPLSHYGRPAPQSAFAPYDGRVQYYEEAAGSPQDFTKIATLMKEEEDEMRRDHERMSRSGSNSTNSVERSSSWGGYDRKHSLVARETSIGSFAPYDAQNEEDGVVLLDDTLIHRSKSMPHPKPKPYISFPSPPLPVQNRKKPEIIEKEASPVEKDVERPSLLRKISGGLMHPCPPPAPTDGVCRPEPVKRDTSNQPESLETKRSVKRVVLSRDASGISRALKEDQKKVAVSSKLSKAELLDRNLSVEINKLGLGDRPSSLSRMTTDQLLNSLLDDDVQNSLLEPEPLTLEDRVSTIDAIAMGIASGRRTQSCDMDDALGLIMDDAEDTDVADAPSAVNDDIAAKWIKGESFAEEDANSLC